MAEREQHRALLQWIPSWLASQRLSVIALASTTCAIQRQTTPTSVLARAEHKTTDSSTPAVKQLDSSVPPLWVPNTCRLDSTRGFKHAVGGGGADMVPHAVVSQPLLQLRRERSPVRVDVRVEGGRQDIHAHAPFPLAVRDHLGHALRDSLREPRQRPSLCARLATSAPTARQRAATAPKHREDCNKHTSVPTPQP